MKKITLASGEESGEKYGAMLASALRDRTPDLRFFGMGGDEMRRAGIEIINDIDELSVVGFFEVLAHFPAVLGAFRKMKEHLIREKPDLLILIDFPDFNIRLARYAKKLGIRILYFISPQVWAWRKNRVKVIADLVDAMIVIFPFERDLYARHGVKIHFVGHPLIDIVKVTSSKNDTKNTIGIPASRRLIGLLPGSRNSEVKRILPAMLGAARLLSREYDDLSFIIPAGKNVESEMIGRMVKPYDDLSLHISRSNYYNVVNALDCAAVASGTATVECALLGIPMVVVYRLNPLTYFLAKLMVDIRNFAMVNLIAGKEIVPELLQNECSEEQIANSLKRYLGDEYHLSSVKEKLNAIKDKLGDRGMFGRAAEKVLLMIE